MDSLIVRWCDIEYRNIDVSKRRIFQNDLELCLKCWKLLLVYARRCTKMIWNYIETLGLVSLYISLHTVFQNLVALVITSDKTMWGYQELQVSCKLKYGP